MGIPDPHIPRGDPLLDSVEGGGAEGRQGCGSDGGGGKAGSRVP